MQTLLVTAIEFCDQNFNAFCLTDNNFIKYLMKRIYTIYFIHTYVFICKKCSKLVTRKNQINFQIYKKLHDH